VAGGELEVAHAGPSPDEADAVVLAIHGITSNLMIWRSVARSLADDGSMTLLAPDLRGRGESVRLPAPYGIGAHVRDMLTVLDYFGVERAVLAGHSMGAYVSARLARERPERAAGLVLVDGGPSADSFTPESAAFVRAVTVGPAMARQAISVATEEAWLEFWRQHPALAPAWNEDVEAYVLHDLFGEPGSMGYVLNLHAVEADGDEMLSDPANRTSLDGIDVPLILLRAPRGTLDDDNPMIPAELLRRFAAAHPAALVEEVDGVNHYTVVLGDSPGPERVVAAIQAIVRVGSA
jgi:pimeloyl-ACP methyl ester carboxylesterase